MEVISVAEREPRTGTRSGTSTRNHPDIDPFYWLVGSLAPGITPQFR